MSIATVIVGILLLILIIPLALYTVGFCLPSEHIVTRTIKYSTTAEILWAILTSVEDYPAWRSHVDQIHVDDEENELNKYEETTRTTFIEFDIQKDKRTIVTHIEQEPERKLLRVLEEKSNFGSSSIFTGSWTLTIEPVQGERAVTLKITEQGHIKKPMVRVSHKLLFGHHRRIDRFLKDLGKEIELGILEPKEEDEEEQTIEQELQRVSEEPLEEEAQSSEHEVGPDESMMEGRTFIERDWDIISEIYDKK